VCVCFRVCTYYVYTLMCIYTQPVAFRVSFNLNPHSQSPFFFLQRNEAKETQRTRPSIEMRGCRNDTPNARGSSSLNTPEAYSVDKRKDPRTFTLLAGKSAYFRQILRCSRSMHALHSCIDREHLKICPKYADFRGSTLKSA